MAASSVDIPITHSCFFTGQWPFQLNSQWRFTLDTPHPTLAEYVASRGYQTAGFAANTNCCSYESGLDRGFAHFEDYARDAAVLLESHSSRELGPARYILSRSNYYDKKWIALQSRGAQQINGAFLDWLRRRRPDRPFFAFLNYFDAHEPYVPPAGYEGRFGICPKSSRDYQFLVDYIGMNKNQRRKRDIRMAWDCYDDCIAFLDEQLGRLLAELLSQGLLDNTEVIITSDHGEAFGDHGTCGHSYTLYFDEIGVPLFILTPAAPARRVVDSPVSLRDLPATVVDRLSLAAGSPFPGRSLAAYWGMSPGQEPPGLATALSGALPARQCFSGPATSKAGMRCRWSPLGQHYIRDGAGLEQLLMIWSIDSPSEQSNLMDGTQGKQGRSVFRSDAPRCIDRQPRFDRGGRDLPGVFQAIA